MIGLKLSILVTGGAGYIGSHFIKTLVENEDDVIVIDNLSRGHREAINKKAVFEEVDLLDFNGLVDTLKMYEIDSAVHFAAFAYVGESVENPQLYYTNNVVGSLNLFKALNEVGVKKIVFSSTCSVYGNPKKIPISEKESIKPINPYAKTKYIIENILADFEEAYSFQFVSLRYFNAAGADPEGELGESHNPEPHLIPIVLNAAAGKIEKVQIFGDEYQTPDGTCIRDYIHVSDLADAHLKALNYLEGGKKSEIINLGTGKGNSVKEVLEWARKITGKHIVEEVADRRKGDPAILVADNIKAKKILGWTPQYDIKEIIETAWNWHKNPKY